LSGALKFHLLGLIDNAHAALAELLDGAILPDGGAINDEGIVA
jgi:hypothetical protein